MKNIEKVNSLIDFNYQPAENNKIKKAGIDFIINIIAKELEDPFYLKDPELVKIFEKCKPPKEAYLYFPKGEEIIVMNEKNPRASYRKIYYNVPYFDYEKEEINNLKEARKKIKKMI